MNSHTNTLPTLLSYRFARASIIAAALLLLGAIPNMPYPYYEIMRLYILVYSLLRAVSAFSSNNQGWGVSFILLAILYNPIVKFRLEAETWQILDIVFAFYIFLSFSELVSYKGDSSASGALPSPKLGPATCEHAVAREQTPASIAHTQRNDVRRVAGRVEVAFEVFSSYIQYRSNEDKRRWSEYSASRLADDRYYHAAIRDDRGRSRGHSYIVARNNCIILEFQEHLLI